MSLKMQSRMDTQRDVRLQQHYDWNRGEVGSPEWNVALFDLLRSTTYRRFGGPPELFCSSAADGDYVWWKLRGEAANGDFVQLRIRHSPWDVVELVHAEWLPAPSDGQLPPPDARFTPLGEPFQLAEEMRWLHEAKWIGVFPDLHRDKFVALMWVWCHLLRIVEPGRTWRPETTRDSDAGE